VVTLSFYLRSQAFSTRFFQLILDTNDVFDILCGEPKLGKLLDRDLEVILG
jgi:hypothetical protein